MPVVNIYVKKDNEYKDLIEAVRTPVITIENYIDKIKLIIRDKNKKSYKKKCEKIELFIYDSEEYFYNKDIIIVNKLLVNKEILELVENSMFTTVYILTKYNEKSAIITIGQKTHIM